MESLSPTATTATHDTQANAWFWGTGAGMADTRRDLELAAQKDLHVLIVGETGTGKEIVAQQLHRQRRERLGFSETDAPFVPLNCGAIPESLSESILFGHERGAFTSARDVQMGKFEVARRGTLFLDEIQDLPSHTQIKLLRVLQNRSFERLGARKSLPMEARVIAATNVPLELLVQKGLFRKDLYYRLNICPVYIPSLRQRPADLPWLVKGLLARIQREQSLPIETVSPEVFDLFLAYRWPGNLRELEHVLLYAALRSQHIIELSALPPYLTGKLGRYLTEGDWQA